MDGAGIKNGLRRLAEFFSLPDNPEATYNRYGAPTRQTKNRPRQFGNGHYGTPVPPTSRFQWNPRGPEAAGATIDSIQKVAPEFAYTPGKLYIGGANRVAGFHLWSLNVAPESFECADKNSILESAAVAAELQTTCFFRSSTVGKLVAELPGINGEAVGLW